MAGPGSKLTKGAQSVQDRLEVGQGAISEQPASGGHPENLSLSRIKLGGEDGGAGGVTTKTCLPERMVLSYQLQQNLRLGPPVTFNSGGIKKKNPIFAHLSFCASRNKYPLALWCVRGYVPI